MRAMILIIALAFAGTAAACARQAGVENGQVEPAAGPVAVAVDNQYALPMSVYVVADNLMPMKLGTVLAGTKERFAIDPDLVRRGMLRIRAQPTGGGQVVDSGMLSLSPGDTVDFYIGLDLVDSRALIGNR